MTGPAVTPRAPDAAPDLGDLLAPDATESGVYDDVDMDVIEAALDDAGVKGAARLSLLKMILARLQPRFSHDIYVYAFDEVLAAIWSWTHFDDPPPGPAERDAAELEERWRAGEREAARRDPLARDREAQIP